jgi:hypothetical protein
MCPNMISGPFIGQPQITLCLRCACRYSSAAYSCDKASLENNFIHLTNSSINNAKSTNAASGTQQETQISVAEMNVLPLFRADWIVFSCDFNRKTEWGCMCVIIVIIIVIILVIIIVVTGSKQSLEELWKVLEAKGIEIAPIWYFLYRLQSHFEAKQM